MVNPARFASTAAVGNLAKTANKYSAEQNDHHEEGSGVNPIEGTKFSELSKSVRIDIIKILALELVTQRSLYRGLA